MRLFKVPNEKPGLILIYDVEYTFRLTRKYRWGNWCHIQTYRNDKPIAEHSVPIEFEQIQTGGHSYRMLQPATVLS